MRALKFTPSNSKLSDSEIIYRVIAGEKELYELLLRRNNQKLFRVIRGYIKDTYEVEDVMQDTYIKAYEKLHLYKHMSKFSTWLIRIGINEALARLKQKGKIRFIDSTSNESNTNQTISMRKNQQLSPEEIMIQQEGKFIIEKAIDLLDSKHKVVFIMKEVEGMSIKEISECLDLSTSNVKVRLHRAKAMLKEKLIEIHLKKDVFEFGFSRCDNIVSQVMKKI